MGNKRHDERCHDCKDRVRMLLTAIFDRVEANWDLDLPAKVADYTGTSIYEILKKIHEALCKYRGFELFVKSKKLPRVDFFIPEKKIVIEFDESQHFTKPRAIALQHYPRGKNFGFSIERWRALCEELNSKDNSPPYRDEQRAWYDTLRDLSPILWKRGKTVRLYSRDLVWCSLRPNRQSDLLSIKRLISERSRDK
jgi:hypothetical protein